MSQSFDTCIILPRLSSQHEEYVLKLAEKLGLPLEKTLKNTYRYHLVYTDNRLELQHNPDFSPIKEKPISVDFCKGSITAKRLSTASVKSPLAKAAGIKPGRRPTIADVTAGLGTDGVTLALLGCKVFLVERNPVIFALLQDGINRAINDNDVGRLLQNNLQLHWGDSISFLSQLPFSPHTIMLDPMYPFRKKSPCNKKEMRVIRYIVGSDDDHHDLFTAAFKIADKRVVVKRPKGGKAICEAVKPSHHIAMKSGRFDVYIKHQKEAGRVIS
ncbi:MAG: class I SAM-dependent methyltransferase [Desulfopila sp.]|jgi:16S rRNA (guanine1516-N2)-methyltransferase|nr:class I SAM-dependent methyltransferase [Desulfopila sp.]